MNIDFTNLFILDCKSTIWDTNKPPNGERSEVVRIDIAIIDTEKNVIKEAEIIHIAPEHSKVSAYCKQYFNLNLDKIQNGISFREAYRKLRVHYMIQDRLWASWGSAEKGMLDLDCQKNNIETLLSNSNFDVQHYFSLMLGLENRLGLTDARKHIDLAYSDNDAVSIGQIFMRMASGLRQSKGKFPQYYKN